MTDETRGGGVPEFDVKNLYREEIYTDLRVGTIRKMLPVTVEGTADAARTPVFTGEATIMTQAGPLPLNFRIAANTLQEAIDAFPDAVAGAIEDMMEEAREMQRREASRIVLPGQDVKSKLQLP